MHVRMSDPERALFESFLRCSRRYVEFGTGGSTCLAASAVSGSALSVDSSSEWIENVRAECSKNEYNIKPTFLHVDIGEIGEWGYPKDKDKMEIWINYHTSVWSHPNADRADLYLVDGRFRVACFMQTLLHSRPDALICIHDFASRPQYHVVHEVAQEIAKAEDFSVFVRKFDYDPYRAVAILSEYALNAS